MEWSARAGRRCASRFVLSRRSRCTAASLAALLAVVPAVHAVAVATGIQLPVPADESTARFDAANLLGRGEAGEVPRLPGGVSDEEIVRVGLRPDGGFASVTVDQALTLSGTGDFSFAIRGPATDVTAPQDQAVQPGLRRGSVIWQGFSSGRRVLRSTVSLDLAFERFSLPVTAEVRVTRDGVALTPPYEGSVEISVRLANRTARPVIFAGGDAASSPLASALDAAHNVLRRRARPIAGEDGVPAVLPGTRTGSSQQAVQIPLRVSGGISFASGSLEEVSVEGASGSGLRFDALMPSVSRPDGVMSFRIRGDARGLSPPVLSMTVRGEAPDAKSLQAPLGSWSRSLGTVEARARALESLQRALWESLRLVETDEHLGNPGKGASSTTFLYGPAAPQAGVQLPVREPFRPGAFALVLVALTMLAGNAAALWRRA